MSGIEQHIMKASYNRYTSSCSRFSIFYIFYFLFPTCSLFTQPVPVCTLANVMNVALLIYCTMCSEVSRHQRRVHRGNEAKRNQVYVVWSETTILLKIVLMSSWWHKCTIKAQKPSRPGRKRGKKIWSLSHIQTDILTILSVGHLHWLLRAKRHSLQHSNG